MCCIIKRIQAETGKKKMLCFEQNEGLFGRGHKGKNIKPKARLCGLRFIIKGFFKKYFSTRNEVFRGIGASFFS